MLVNKGLVYNNFFANGQRSIEGAQAILTGIPPLPGIPDITVLPVNYSRLGNIAKASGYRTIFVTTTLRESFSLDLMVYAAGIEEYYGQEDYPILLNYIDDPERYLGWDYDAFMHLLNKKVMKINLILQLLIPVQITVLFFGCMNHLLDMSMGQILKGAILICFITLIGPWENS